MPKLGLPLVLPEGYEYWTCDYCTAGCNFEAMHLCARREDPNAECGFEKDQPESLGGMFEFIKKVGSPK